MLGRAADTANFGEVRSLQKPLQIKIGDRFDQPEVHARIRDGLTALEKTAPVPNVDIRTSLNGTLVEYPWG